MHFDPAVQHMSKDTRQLACFRAAAQVVGFPIRGSFLERGVDVTDVMKNLWRQTAVLALLSCASAARPVAADGQENPLQKFDVDRAWIVDSTMFEPFVVSETRRLRDVLDDNAIHAGTPVVVLQHPAGRLALLTEQMVYHHAAQGEINGEPWMVSF